MHAHRESHVFHRWRSQVAQKGRKIARFPSFVYWVQISLVTAHHFCRNVRSELIRGERETIQPATVINSSRKKVGKINMYVFVHFKEIGPFLYR